MEIHLGGVNTLQDIRFGPAGYPEDAKGSVERVFEILKDLRLNALEYAAVYGLRLGETKAMQIGQLARKNSIYMTMHGAYYISLASKSKQTRIRSRQRLMKSLEFAPMMNVKRIIFHPGSYSGLSPEEGFQTVKTALIEVWNATGHLAEGAYLAPEIAGKKGAFGSTGEIIRLCQEVEGCIPTIDWAHLYARTQGEINDKESYRRVLGIFEDSLGDLFLDNMHFHISGITFTSAGEKAHRPLGDEWGPDILPLIEVITENGYKPTFISETPSPIKGALYAKFIFEELEKKNK